MISPVLCRRERRSTRVESASSRMGTRQCSYRVHTGDHYVDYWVKLKGHFKKRHHVDPHGFVSLYTPALASRTVSTLRSRIPHMPTLWPTLNLPPPSPPSLSPFADTPH